MNYSVRIDCQYSSLAWTAFNTVDIRLKAGEGVVAFYGTAITYITVVVEGTVLHIHADISGNFSGIARVLSKSCEWFLIRVSGKDRLSFSYFEKVWGDVVRVTHISTSASKLFSPVVSPDGFVVGYSTYSEDFFEIPDAADLMFLLE